MFEVERWNNWDYPSHWVYEENFPTLEEAIAYCQKQNDSADYRVIQILWHKD